MHFYMMPASQRIRISRILLTMTFNLDNMTDDECKTEFRFFRNDIYNLINVLRVPAELTCYNGLKDDPVEAMCIFLKRFAYPYRYSELIPRFAKLEPQLCMIANQMTSVIYDNWRHLFITFEQPG